MSSNTSQVDPTTAKDVVVTKEEVADPSSLTAMQVLLGAKPVRQEQTITVTKRQGLDQDLVLTIKSLTDREFKMIGDQSEFSTGRNRSERRAAGKSAERETDNSLFLRLIVSTAVIEPNFNAPEVLKAHGCFSGDEVVGKVLLPGEVAKIAEEVMTVSGWADDSVLVGK